LLEKVIGIAYNTITGICTLFKHLNCD